MLTYMKIRYHAVNVSVWKGNSQDVKIRLLCSVAAGNFQNVLQLSSAPVLGHLDLAGPGLEDLHDTHDPPRVRLAVVGHCVHI